MENNGSKTDLRGTEETPEQVAQRWGKSLDWAREHYGYHRCVDGRHYAVSCLITDPTCEHLARYSMDRAARRPNGGE